MLEALEDRSAAGAGAGTGPEAESAPGDAGVPAAEAFAAAARGLPPLPVLPGTPGQPPTLDTESEPAGLDVDAVEFLAQAAASEAFRLLAEALAPGHAARAPRPPLTTAEDAVRLTAEAGDFRLRFRLAAATGRDRASTDRAVRAWGFGGAPALAALEDDWTPDRATLARAGSALAAAWPDEEAPVLRRVRARWTASDGERQLRLDRDGRWWPLRREAARWHLAGPSAPDPASALTSLDPPDPPHSPHSPDHPDHPDHPDPPAPATPPTPPDPQQGP